MQTTQWEVLEKQIIACRRCPRLVEWRERVASERKKAYRDVEYWGRPVPGFGDRNAGVLVIGLAPGAHGSNRTGRMFTGDASGEFLYPALYRAGFSSWSRSTSRDDDLRLNDLFITALCRCAPPDNKPTPEEIRNCLPFMEHEIRLLVNARIFVALGALAYHWGGQILLGRKFTMSERFKHGGVVKLAEEGRWLLASFHPSRQNTQTGRLTAAMFDKIWKNARRLLE